MPSDKPAKIGKYDIIDVIGRGGMGIVYKATDPNLDRLVAIKMMTGGYASNPERLKRFFREAQSTGGLQHPNIVTIFELGDHGGNPYLVMEYLEGNSLDSIIHSQRPISLLEKLSTIMEVCYGLSYAHARGIVHRDIKPANIMVSHQGAVKIVDFGIAHIGDKNATSTGQIMGSLGYMSPEQVNGKPVDSRSDIFSTGVVLYQLCTHAMPFDGQSTAATLMKIMNDPPPPMKNFLTVYPPELETVILRALAKDREERFQSADDFALDLGQLHGQLKQEIITHHLEQAALLIERADAYQAREQLLQVLKIDRQHTRATHLLREVQQRIQKEEIGEQVKKLRLQAEGAYARGDFESALKYLEAALRLDRDSGELLHLRESARIARANKLPAKLRFAGDYWPEDLLRETLTDLPAAPEKSAAENSLQEEVDRHNEAQPRLEGALQSPPVAAVVPSRSAVRSEKPVANPAALDARELHAEPASVEAHSPAPPAVSGANALSPIETPTPGAESGPPSAVAGAGGRLVSFGNIAGWQEETLRAVEHQLALFIGPLARIVIKKAACKTTHVDKLYDLLAVSLEKKSDREEFLSGKIQVKVEAPAVSGPQPVQSVSMAEPPSSDGRGELTTAVIELAARQLARHVGPISTVLAKRAAQRAENRRGFYLLLAEHVPAKAERDRFLQDAGFTGS
jgi:serine/threonine protein kinase